MVKKNIRVVSLIFGMALICLAFTGCGKESKVSITMDEMVNAGKTENLLAQYSSFESSVIYGEDNYTIKEYVDKDIVYAQYQEDAELYIGGELRYISTNGTLGGGLFVDKDPTRFYAEQNVFYSDEGFTETVKSCEKRDGKLNVSTELSAEDTQRLVTDRGYTYNEGETMRLDYVLDAETLAVLSQKEILVANDGAERTFLTLTVVYDAARPAAAKTMYEHATATENLRTVTVISNPDTTSEKTFTVQVPKGDSVSVYAPAEYTNLYMNRSCTDEVVSVDQNEDFTAYIKKAS